MMASARFLADTVAVAVCVAGGETVNSVVVVVAVDHVAVAASVVDVVMESSAVVAVDAVLRAVMAGWLRGRRRAWTLSDLPPWLRHSSAFCFCDQFSSETNVPV